MRATPDIIEALAARSEVERIEANSTIKNHVEPQLSQAEIEEAALARERATALAPEAPEAVEPGITATRAPEEMARRVTSHWASQMPQTNTSPLPQTSMAICVPMRRCDARATGFGLSGAVKMVS